MRKHFLILMLMALLPLAGFAQTKIDLSGKTVKLNRTELDYVGKSTSPAIIGISGLTDAEFKALGIELGVDYKLNKIVRNAGTYTAAFEALTTSEKLEGTSNNFDFEIKKAPLVVTLKDASKVYGSVDPTELEWTYVNSNQLKGDDNENSMVFEYTLKRETGVDVGTYKYTEVKISATPNNYDITFTNSVLPSLEITKKELQANYSGSLDKNYGEANPAFDATKFTFVGWAGKEVTGTDEEIAAAKKAVMNELGTISYTQPIEEANATSGGTLLTGKEAYPLIFGTMTAKNYKLVAGSGATMKIKQIDFSKSNKMFTVTKANDDLTYNGEGQIPTFTLKYKDAQNVTHTLVHGKDFTTSYKSSADLAGIFSETEDTVSANYYKVTFNGEGNYGASFADKFTYQIKKKNLDVYALEETKVYSDKSLKTDIAKFEYHGLIDGDEDYVVATGAKFKDDDSTEKSKVGEYKVVPTGIKAGTKGDKTANYNFNAEVSTWTITKRPVTVTAKDQQIVYGADAPVLANTAAFVIVEEKDDEKERGPLNESSVTSILGKLTLSWANGETPKTEAGEYENEIVITVDPTYDGAYEIVPVAGKYTIVASELKLYPRDKEVVYGTAYSKSDFKYKSTLDVVPGAEVEYIVKDNKGNVLDELPTQCGTYVIEIVPNNAYLVDNFGTLAYETGKLKITEKPITIIPESQNVKAGETEAALQTYNIADCMVSIEGLVGDDKVAYDLKFNTAKCASIVDGEGALQQPIVDIPNETHTDPITDATIVDSYHWNVATQTWTNGIIVAEPSTIDETVYANKNYKITWGKTADLKVSNNPVIVLDVNKDVIATIKAANGVTNAEVRFVNTDKQIKKDQWNTLVLPFQITVADLSSKLGYAVVDMIDAANENVNTVSFKLAFGTIPANTAILVQPRDTKNLKNLVFTGVTVSSANINEAGEAVGAADKANHYFVGAYEDYKVLAENDNEYVYVAADHAFKNAAKASTIRPFAAFLRDANTASKIMSISIQEADGTTSIKNINGETVNRTAEGWYNLNGMKIAAPTQSGIYIHNGKKVVIK